MVIVGRGGAGSVRPGGGDGTVTVSRVVSEALPPGPVAVAVYVTDEAGLTVRVPDAVTLPTSGWISTDAAFWASQRSVLDCPLSIVAGSARNVIVGNGGGGGAGCTGAGGETGGGAAATRFLQPTANEMNSNTEKRKSIFDSSVRVILILPASA